MFVTIWWKCSCCGKRFWPHVPPRHNECSKAMLMGEGIAGAAGAGPTQASLGWGWRWPLFGLFDLEQDLKSENKMEKVGSASSFTNTVKEEHRKETEARVQSQKWLTKQRHGRRGRRAGTELAAQDGSLVKDKANLILKGVNGSVICKTWEEKISAYCSSQLCDALVGALLQLF